jgi:hypothetical protein
MIRVNQSTLTGVVRSVKVNGANREDRKPSAIFMLQYGKNRQRTGGPVEFVNAVLVRVPAYRYEKVRDRLVEGAEVAVSAHVQGLMKYYMSEPVYSIEIVADHIEFAEDEYMADDPAEEAVAAE